MKDIQKTLPKHWQKRGWIEKCDMLWAYGMGLLFSVIGREPPKPSTPRLAVEKWMHWFQKNASTLSPVRGHVLVLGLRNKSWIGWAFYAACWMRRLGFAPIILFSLRDIHKVYGVPGKQSMKQKFLYGEIWEQLNRIPDAMSINVDEMPEPSADSLLLFDDYVSRQAYTNGAYELLVEEYEQGPMKEEYDQLVVELRGDLYRETAQAYELLLKLKSEYGVGRIIGSSGTIGRSACYEGAAKELGLIRVWVESWGILPGLMRYNINKPALEFSAKEWVDALRWDEEEQSEMESFLDFQETNKGKDGQEKKMQGHLRYQIVDREAEWPADLKQFIQKDDRPIFLLATNVVGDSATLQRQTIFDSQRAWILEVIQYFKEHPGMRLMIRAHPSERVYELKGCLHVNLGKIAEECAADVENVYVVQWQDPVNTYSLIPYIRGGLTWVSNTGVDLVVRNIPAISAASPVYGGLGITEEPSSKEEYFSLIERFARKKENPSRKQIETAKKFIYVIYKKIGYPAYGPRNQITGLWFDLPDTDKCARFYRIIAGVE